MARWNPDFEKIDPKELLGRRLFDHPSLAGAADQKHRQGLDLRNFEDQRDGQVSLDRLGRSNAEMQVITYLTPRAEAAARKLIPIRPFSGWVHVQAKVLLGSKKLPITVVPSPIVSAVSPVTQEDELNENQYHAHVQHTGENPPPPYFAYSVALHLKELFEKYGGVHQTNSKPQERPDQINPRSALVRLWNKVQRLVAKIQSKWIRRASGPPSART